MEIKRNDYDISTDERVPELVHKVQDMFESGAREVNLSSGGVDTKGWVKGCVRHVAEHVAHLFVVAGYYATSYYRDGGYWGYVTISKEPQDVSFMRREIT